MGYIPAMEKPKKVLFRCRLCPGDIVTLTAAVRDLHKAHPGKYLTGVDTTCAQLWHHNPYITWFKDEEESEVEVHEVHYPQINRSNQEPYHFIHGYAMDIADKLNIPKFKITEFKGDIHLHPNEKVWMSQVQEITGTNEPFWIICAGGKYDFTIKWWEHKRYQEVVNHFKGKIRFVQVGEERHNHLPLENVIDLRGKTDLRQLTRLVYHSQGVLCGVTSLMHLAAAVPTKYTLNRPCVVVAGGREPMHWEAYPFHQYIHTIGALKCCAHGGCWKARTKPIGDGDRKDELLCLDVVNDSLPRCMDMITSAEVIRRIEMYFNGGIIEYLENEKSI